MGTYNYYDEQNRDYCCICGTELTKENKTTHITYEADFPENSCNDEMNLVPKVNHVCKSCTKYHPIITTIVVLIHIGLAFIFLGNDFFENIGFSSVLFVLFIVLLAVFLGVVLGSCIWIPIARMFKEL